jgi:hypothetical protein
MVFYEVSRIHYLSLHQRDTFTPIFISDYAAMWHLYFRTVPHVPYSRVIGGILIRVVPFLADL